jgi:hypothetical protein
MLRPGSPRGLAEDSYIDFIRLLSDFAGLVQASHYDGEAYGGGCGAEMPRKGPWTPLPVQPFLKRPPAFFGVALRLGSLFVSFAEFFWVRWQGVLLAFADVFGSPGLAGPC